MNNVIELKGKRFTQASKKGGNGGASINGMQTVTSNQLAQLKTKLIKINEFWDHEQRPFSGILVSVYYNKIVAKSNRIAGLFKKKDSNKAIVGAKFNKEKNKHIITYYLDAKDLNNSISLLSKVNLVVDSNFKEGINKSIFDDKAVIDNVSYSQFNISKTVFKQVIADVSYIENFEVEKPTSQFSQSIVTLYDTKMDTKTLFQMIGIDILSTRILDQHTVFLDENQIKVLFEKAPYLVSMETVNLQDLSPEDFIKEDIKDRMFIPSPATEPTIGVIDTLFDKRVYFSQWVEYQDMLDDNIPKNSRDYRHGTEVSSIIVDGPKLNPWLDDGCGRFRVRHFGVATASKFSSFTIIKNIKSIISNNPDIKVWNISLGSNQEVNDNFISAEAATLDKIQFENDVIFVVAGTNKVNESIYKIGSPADSINSMVVNAVTINNKPTKYSRRGLALSFYAKPDVSYYGGSEEKYIKVCGPLGEALVAGTSFAAPWIARKLSYLIDVLDIKREIAKALIIDAARQWNDRPKPQDVAVYGHGIVPIKISDIVQSKDNEIKFVVTDVSEKWNTYNYYFPIPLKDDKYPYQVKATMCYFPNCNRTQGVDYTNTELNLKFGRIKDNGTIYDIKGDTQNQEESLDGEISYILEGEARKRFRKWDNVKYIGESLKSKTTPKKSYQTNKDWGMEIKTNNRLDEKDGMYLRFGVVVTLREINGINRMDEFIRNCALKGWIVNEIDIKNRIEIHSKVNEEVEFD